MNCKWKQTTLYTPLVCVSLWSVGAFHYKLDICKVRYKARNEHDITMYIHEPDTLNQSKCGSGAMKTAIPFTVQRSIQYTTVVIQWILWSYCGYYLSSKMFIASLLAVRVLMTNEWQLKIVAFLMPFLENQIFIASNDTINIFRLMCPFVFNATQKHQTL